MTTSGIEPVDVDSDVDGNRGQADSWLLSALLGDVEKPQSSAPAAGGGFLPRAPQSLAETGLEETQIEALVLKFLMHRGSASGRQVAEQLRLPFGIVSELTRRLKEEQVLGYRRSSGLQDYELQLSDTGTAQAKRYAESSRYYGTAPVPYKDYVESIGRQSPSRLKLSMAHLRRALSDLKISDGICSRLGQAMTAGRALFLYGRPGNGKTSIAERLSAAYGEAVWIPRAVDFDGEIVRLYDPIVHEEVPDDDHNPGALDQRWIRIRRPTIVVGGELRMEHLEVVPNTSVGVCEAPVHLKSNCGVLVVDDFGRQRLDPTELLNRWIVPLEKRYDFFNLPSGKKVQIPFDQLLIFSTNLEPKHIVDEAFLRRIPYKIEIGDPSEQEFRELFQLQSEQFSLNLEAGAVDHLIDRHYRAQNRPLRFCQPRDLLLQVSNFCEFHDAPRQVTTAQLDDAVHNYFGLME